MSHKIIFSIPTLILSSKIIALFSFLLEQDYSPGDEGRRCSRKPIGIHSRPDVWAKESLSISGAGWLLGVLGREPRMIQRSGEQRGSGWERTRMKAGKDKPAFIT